MFHEPVHREGKVSAHGVVSQQVLTETLLSKKVQEEKEESSLYPPSPTS